jgi:predicted dehydrogenase
MNLRCVGIVGIGSIGRRHLRVLKTLGNDIYVIGVRSKNTIPIPEEYLINEIVPSVQNAIEVGCQAAIVCTPAPFHLKNAQHFLAAGIPILIEKPLCANLKDALELERISSFAGTPPVLLGYTLRHSRLLAEFQVILQQNLIGRILSVDIECASYLPEWRPGIDYRSSVSACSNLGGGVLLELSHEIDYANLCFGPLNRVSAIVTNSGTLDIDVEDSSDLFLTSHLGFTVRIHLSFCRRDTVRECRVYGEHGAVIADFISQKLKIKRSGDAAVTVDCSQERDSIFEQQLQHFFGCVQNTVKPCCTVRDGIEVLEIIEAAKESSSLKREVIL